MPRKRRALVPEKVRLVQVARRGLAMEEADYRSLLRRVGGVGSSRDLSDDGFRLLMECFARLGFTSTSCARHGGRREGMASAGHVAGIRRLWAEYTGRAGTDAELRGFLEKTWGVSSPRFLTAEQGPAVVRALRAMCERPAAATAGAGGGTAEPAGFGHAASA